MWFHLKATPGITYTSNAVINKKVEIERIDHGPIKYGKKKRNINTKMREKLSFLCHNGRMVQIEIHLRNKKRYARSPWYINYWYYIITKQGSEQKFICRIF